MKPSKESENGRPIPVKVYNFQVDFKLGEEEVMTAFLDPKENKHISIVQRPQTSRVGTFGTASRYPSKKSITVSKSQNEPKLALIGSTGSNTKDLNQPQPSIEPDENQSPLPKQENNKSTFMSHDAGLSKNLFRFTCSLPTKKLSDNPNLALGIMKKKTLGNKSQGVIKGPNPDTTDISIYPDPVQQFNLLGKPNERPQSASIVKGLPPGKKITRDSLQFLQKKKEEYAGVSSGQSVTFDKKKKVAKFGDEKSKRPNSASAHVSAALDFMRKLTGKEVKKPNNEFDDDGLAEVDPKQEEEEESPKPKPRPQSAQLPIKMKEFKTKEPNNIAEPVEELKLHNSQDEGHEIISLDGGDNKHDENDDDEFARADGQDNEHGDQDENEEDLNDRAEPDLTLTGKRAQTKSKDENIDPNIEKNPNPNEENDLFKKEEDLGGDQAAPPIVNKYHSQTAKALAGLNPSLLYGSKEDTRLSESRELVPKPNTENKEKQNQESGVNEKPRRKGVNNVQPVVSKLNTGIDKIIRSVDPNVAEEHKQKVTEQVKAYLAQADEKRKKLYGVTFGDREEAQPAEEEQDDGKNNYTQKISKINTNMDSSIQKMKNIISDSKSLDYQIIESQKKWTEKKIQGISTPEEFFQMADKKIKELENQKDEVPSKTRDFHFDQMEPVKEWDRGSVGSVEENNSQ